MWRVSLSNLFRRKQRTFLALLGIVIGVSAIMSLVSVIDGVQSEFDVAVSSIKSVLVLESGAIDQTLSFIDSSYEQKLKKISGVGVVVPEVWKVPFEVNGKPNQFSIAGPLSVYGIGLPQYNKLKNPVYSIKIVSGQAIQPGDKKGVVIGKSIADDLHKFVGNKLSVNGQDFVIKGIYKSDSPLFESIITMDIDAARELFNISSEKVSSFYVEPMDPEQDKKIRELINFSFKDKLEASTSSDFSAQFGGILGNLRLLVFVIAALSAFVAGIGIMNTILMSVLERKKEIGALKAVGWTSKEVLKMILLESVFISVLGGIIGVLLGWVFSFLISSGFGIKAVVTPILIIQVFAFALIVGIGSGIYPAWV
ncbi:MAG: ABC transporter permease, partial [Candidatus Diapherotrites archaeon]|nr:ABC transporter permease [Candidatus Diapherotrites archaeon]